MSRPYSNDAQIFTFGVHGTINEPSNVANVTQRVSAAVGQTTTGANLYDSGFSWVAKHNFVDTTDGVGNPTVIMRPVAGTAHLTHGTGDREIAAGNLTTYVLKQVDHAIEAGTLDRNKPLVINLVGFSHGGNVAMLASDNIAAGLRERGLESGIHMTTLSTPAYTRGRESPATAEAGVERQGVNFSHTHFSVKGDGVIRAALGNAHYDANTTRNFDMPAVSKIDPVANHGAPQDSVPHMNGIAETLRQRFNGLAPAQTRAGADAGNETQLASVSPATAGSVNVASASPTLEISSNPLNRQLEQALKGAENKDIAAVAFETIRNAKGYSPNDPICVLQSNHGTPLVAQRLNEPNGIALAVPEAKPGDYERVSTQLAKEQVAQQSVAQLTNTQQNQQTQVQPQQEQEPRKSLSMA